MGLIDIYILWQHGPVELHLGNCFPLLDYAFNLSIKRGFPYVHDLKEKHLLQRERAQIDSPD